MSARNQQKRKTRAKGTTKPTEKRSNAPYLSFFRRHIEGGIRGNPNPEGWVNVICPFHDDREPSLGVNVRHGGWACHAGCAKGNVLDFAELLNIDHADVPGYRVHDYIDEEGVLLFRVIRRPPWDKAKSRFTQRRPIRGDSWTKELGNVHRVPYRLPELLGSTGSIYITEGEKDADALVGLGLTVTTNPGGAGRWTTYAASLRPHFKGRDVVILPDNDDEGRRHGEEVAHSLHEIARSVKVLLLPGLPDKGDASDWLEAGGTRKALERLAGKAEEWKPPSAAGPGQPSDEPRRSGPVREGRNYYEKLERGDKWRPITNFILRPVERLLLDDGEHLSLDIITKYKTYKHIPFPPEAWNGKSSFRRCLRRQDLSWTGADTDIAHIHALLARQLSDVSERRATRTVGWVIDDEGEGIFVYGEKAINVEGPVDNPTVVYLPHGGRGDLEGKIQYDWPSEAKYKKLARAVFELLPELNDTEAILPIIGWFFATPFKPQIHNLIGHFPILNIWGTTGGGKSTTARLLWRLFGLKGELFSCTGTPFSLLKLFGCTNAIPILLDEYKPNDMGEAYKNRLHRYLRKVYDGEVESRGRPNLTLQHFPLTSPVGLVGEVPLMEAALLQRSLPVNLNPNNLTVERRKAFEALRTLDRKRHLTGFAGRYIQWSLGQDTSRRWANAEKAVKKALKSRNIENDRILDNISTMSLGLQAIRDFANSMGLKAALDDNQAITSQADALLPEGRTKGAIPLDSFMEDLALMAEMGQLRQGTHYLLKSDHDVGYIRLKICHAEFRKFNRQTGAEAEVLNMEAYRKQIRECNDRGGYITSTSKLVRFASEGDLALRSVELNLVRAEKEGLDLSGFRRGAERAEEGASRAREDADQ